MKLGKVLLGKFCWCVVFWGGNPPKKYVLFLLCVCVFRKWCVNGWFGLECLILLLMFTEVLVAFLVVKRRSQIEKRGSTFLVGKGSHLKFVASDGHHDGWLKSPHHQ